MLRTLQLALFGIVSKELFFEFLSLKLDNGFESRFRAWAEVN